MIIYICLLLSSINCIFICLFYIERRYITSLSQDKSLNDILRETKIDNRPDKSSKSSRKNSSNNENYHKMQSHHHQDSLDDVPDFGNQDVCLF